MKMVKVQDLSLEKFSRYGTFANLLDPDTDKLGTKPIEFYRDMLQLDLGQAQPSFSVCRVEKRDLVIDVSEYHNTTCEGIMPLDEAVYVYVAPANGGDRVPLEQIEVFKVPQGTFVALRRGVWHHAPFTVGSKAANVLIVLPERAYAVDCIVHEISAKDRIKISTR
jgi:ureidoglycolate lyase